MKPHKFLFYFFIVLILIFVYAQTFNGDPIWDDFHFIFLRFNNHTPDHMRYWKFHIWPLFDSSLAFLYSIFRDNTLYWHSLNFMLHLTNGFLLARFVRHFKRSWFIPVMLLFWFHPLNVLSVAWIVQLKTVLCGFFFILSLNAALHFWRTKKKVFYISSFLLFTLSVFSKSSVLPFPWIGLLFLFYKQRKLQSSQLLLVPFLIVTLFSTWRIYTNEMVQKRVAESEGIVDQNVVKETETETIVTSNYNEEFESNNSTKIEEIALQKIQNTNDTVSISNTLTPDQAIAEKEATPESAPSVEVNTEITSNQIEKLETIRSSQTRLIIQTLGEYLFKPFFTYPLTPIHGSFKGKIGLKAYLGYALTLILIAVGFYRKSKLALFSFVAIILGLVPFIGFIIVPYMTYSYFSEQHYYLVLPFFIFIQLWLIAILPKKYQSLAFVSVWFVLSYQTVDYASAFKNDEMYFERVLTIDPTDRISLLSLAAHFAHNGQPKRALKIIEKALAQARENPILETDPLHPLFLRAREFYAAAALSQ